LALDSLLYIQYLVSIERIRKDFKMAKHTFKDLTETLKTDKGLSLKHKIYFHAFNPNGACEAKKGSDDAIEEAVEAGIMKSGAILAYGSFSDYHTMRLMKMSRIKRPTGFEVNYTINAIYEDVSRAYAVIKEKKAA
tara:strand:+ start:52 stop:459 length:408 start_codon:yes stop_codon:yes gene_type:complete